MDPVPIKIRNWAAGKERNICALLASLSDVLWEDSNWEQPSMVELSSYTQVKKYYRQACLIAHPDKQVGTSNDLKFAKAIFIVLNSAWIIFEKSRKVGSASDDFDILLNKMRSEFDIKFNLRKKSSKPKIPSFWQSSEERSNFLLGLDKEKSEFDERRLIERLGSEERSDLASALNKGISSRDIFVDLIFSMSFDDRLDYITGFDRERISPAVFGRLSRRWLKKMFESRKFIRSHIIIIECVNDGRKEKELEEFNVYSEPTKNDDNYIIAECIIELKNPSRILECARKRKTLAIYKNVEESKIVAYIIAMRIDQTEKKKLEELIKEHGLILKIADS